MKLMLSCKEVHDDASAYLDGDLSASRKMLIRMHVMMCSRCRRFIRQLRLTVETLKAWHQQNQVTDAREIELADKLHRQFVGQETDQQKRSD